MTSDLIVKALSLIHISVSNTSVDTSTGYTVIMRGDVVPSGYVDGSDFDAVVKHSVCLLYTSFQRSAYGRRCAYG